MRLDFAKIVEGGEGMAPYQYTRMLERRFPSPIMKGMTRHLLRHFLENEEPEAFSKAQLRLHEEATKGIESGEEVMKAQILVRVNSVSSLPGNVTQERPQISHIGVHDACFSGLRKHCLPIGVVSGKQELSEALEGDLRRGGQDERDSVGNLRFRRGRVFHGTY